MTEEPRGTGRFTLRKGPRWFLPESPDVIGQLQTQAELTAKGMRAFAAWAGGTPAEPTTFAGRSMSATRRAGVSSTP